MRNLIFLLVFGSSCILNGQSLIQNGEFELYDTCPEYPSQFHYVQDWMNVTTNINGTSGTPDFYNACSTGDSVDVPMSTHSFQYAHSGNGFAAVVLWAFFFSNYREYIQAPLTSPLSIGNCYHFEMYINLANISKYNTDDIQVYFSDTAVTGINNYLNLSFVPQLSNPVGNNIDTLNWVLFSGDYTAVGGENYLVIGNFQPDSLTSTSLINSSGTSYGSYCFIDDVSLIPCTTGLNNFSENINVKLFPQPATDILIVEHNSSGHFEIVVYNVLGAVIMIEELPNSTSIISVGHLSSGAYSYEIKNNGTLVKQGKLLKN